MEFQRLSKLDLLALGALTFSGSAACVTEARDQEPNFAEFTFSSDSIPQREHASTESEIESDKPKAEIELRKGYELPLADQDRDALIRRIRSGGMGSLLRIDPFKRTVAATPALSNAETIWDPSHSFTPTSYVLDGDHGYTVFGCDETTLKTEVWHLDLGTRGGEPHIFREKIAEIPEIAFPLDVADAGDVLVVYDGADNSINFVDEDNLKTTKSISVGEWPELKGKSTVRASKNFKLSDDSKDQLQPFLERGYKIGVVSLDDRNIDATCSPLLSSAEIESTARIFAFRGSEVIDVEQWYAERERGEGKK